VGLAIFKAMTWRSGVHALACSMAAASGSCSVPGGPTMPACVGLDYLIAPRAEVPLCAAAPCQPLTTPIWLQTEGETLFYTDGSQIVAVDAGGQTRTVATPSVQTTTRADGTTFTWQPSIEQFWIEPARFVVASRDGAYSLPRDGAPTVKLGDPIAYAWKYAKDDAYVYVGTVDGSGSPSGPAVYRVPLAGGSPELIATSFASGAAPFGLFPGVKDLYVYLPDSPASGLVAVARDGSGTTPVALEAFADVVGFDGSAFFLVRPGGPSSTSSPRDIDRDVPGGPSATLWTDATLTIGASQGFAPASGGGYMLASAGPGRNLSQSVVRLTAAGATIQSCATDSDQYLATPAVGAKFVYAVAHGHTAGGNPTWGIARFPL
jgi:hypothetical protein